MIKYNLLIIIWLYALPAVAIKPPFSTIKIDKDVFIDKTEVDVASWLSYYSWKLRNEGYYSAQKVLPDSSAINPKLWSYIKNKSTKTINFVGNYSLQPIGAFEIECNDAEENKIKNSPYCKLLEYPITGVTYEQVVDFCKWRTEIEGKGKLLFRLMYIKEWRKYAKKGLSKFEKSNCVKDSLNKSNCSLFNYKNSFKCNENKDTSIPYPIFSFQPDMNNIYELFGNVSEMTQDKGKAIGGNYTLYASQCHIDSIQYYTKPEKWLGFRCIAVRDTNKGIAKEPRSNLIVESNTKKDEKNSRFGKFVDSRDGKTYPTVLIGDQIWLAANLAYQPDSGKYWIYNNNEKNINLYGCLYTWETAKNVCPLGWHLPSKNDYEILLQKFRGDGRAAFIELSQGGNSGFSIIGSGFRYNINYIPPKGGSAYWTSTEINKRKAWVLRTGGGSVVVLTDYLGKKNGLSIRCIKDNE